MGNLSLKSGRSIREWKTLNFVANVIKLRLLVQERDQSSVPPSQWNQTRTKRNAASK